MAAKTKESENPLKAEAVAEAGASAASKKVTPEAEAGAAGVHKPAAEAPANTTAVATEARAKKKSAAAEARANKKAIRKANKAAAAAQAAAEKPFHFSVPSEDYFKLWKNPKDREEVRACFTRMAELFAQ